MRINPIYNQSNYPQSFRNNAVTNMSTATQSVAQNSNPNTSIQNFNYKNKDLIILGLLPLTFVAAAFAVPSIIKKVDKKAKLNDIKICFQSLKDQNNIPTLSTCKSINKKLRSFLENQVDIINAPAEILVRTGMPDATNRLLMYGEPGSGKSFFAKILAKTIDAEYMEIKYSDLNKQYCGEHLENMKLIFDNIITTAEKSPNKKFVVNFNEIDAIAQSPNSLKNTSGSHNTFKLEERSVFLTYIEEIAEKTPNVILVGSTNMPARNSRLDEAVLSRFKNIIEVTSPDKECMFEALKTHIQTLPEGEEFIKSNKAELEKFAQSLVDRKASFRDVNNIMESSKTYYLKDAIKNKNSKYKFEFLEKARDSVEHTDGEIFYKK